MPDEPISFKLPPPEPTGPPPIGVMLGLGECWQPGAPAKFRWADLNASGQKLHGLIFDTSAGSFGIVLDDAGLKNLEDQCRQRRTGLVAAASPLVVAG